MSLAVAAAVEPLECRALFAVVNFDAAEFFSAGTQPESVVSADFDGDRDLDLATVNVADDEVSMLINRGDGTFARAVNYALGGNNPLGLSVGDFNDDNRPDLAAASVGGDGVRVLLGNGDGTFDPSVFSPVPAFEPLAVAAGDFNGDGRDDLAAVSPGEFGEPGTLSILTGKGDGTFFPAVTRDVGSGAQDVVALDLDRDGDVDLATANFRDGTVSVLRNNGAGSFSSASHYAAIGRNGLSALAAGDVDGDLDVDLVAASQFENAVVVLFNNGGATFGPEPGADQLPRFAVGNTPLSVALGDLNRDGVPEIVTANAASDDVSVLKNEGGGTFRNAAPYVAGNAPQDVVVADLNGDGLPDVAASLFSETGGRVGGVGVLRGRGDTTLRAVRAFQFEFDTNMPVSLTAADFNKDGLPDVAALGGGGVSGRGVLVLLGRPDGSLEPVIINQAGSNPVNSAPADFDRNGTVDLAVVSDSGLTVLRGLGDGRFFEDGPFYSPGNIPDEVVAADFDGDGDADLAVTVGTTNPNVQDAVALMRNNGDGTFAGPVTVALNGLFANGLVAGDLDRDGDADLAAGVSVEGAHRLAVLRNNGAGAFAGPAPAVMPANFGATDVVAADFDRDGDLDLAAAGDHNGSNATVAFFRNNGNATFVAPTLTGAAGGRAVAASVADFDGDGRLDLAVASDGDFVSILRGGGDGAFTPDLRFSPGGLADLVAADFNRDGRPDLATANPEGRNVAVALNSGPAGPGPREDGNDQIAEAANLSLGSSVTQSITPGSDVDMFKLTVQAGQKVGFDVDATQGSSLDSYLRVFDSAGQQLAANDDGAAPGEGASARSYLEFTFAAGGTYYVGMSGDPNRTYNAVTGTGNVTGSAGGYVLRLNNLGFSGDSDDQISEATGVTIGSTLTGKSVAFAQDVDMFKVTVGAGQRVGFDVDAAAGSNLNSYLRLFDAAGNQLAFNDDGAAPGENPNPRSYIEYTFASAGTYYVGVSGSPNRNYNPVTGAGDANGSTGGFTLSVTNRATPQTFQAESARFGGAVVSTQHAGFTGSGFVDFTDPDDGFIEWTVNSAARRTVALEFRYAAGTSPDRPLALVVNGQRRDDLVVFQSTGSWSTWRTVSINSALLEAGSNTVRLQAAGVGGPNVDSLVVR